MLRTFVWVLWLFCYFIFRLPAYWKAKRLGKQGRLQEQKEFINNLVGTWARNLLKNVGVTVTVYGRENLPQKGETVVFVANHQSYFDILVTLAYLDEPHALLAKDSLGKIPFLSQWMKLLGCVYVVRDDAKASMLALRQAEETLNSGNSMIVFPEGTRSKSNNMGEFKAGAVRMAYKAGVNVVPVAIDGTYRALEGNGLKLRRCHVNMKILPAVSAAKLSREEQKQLPQKLEDMVRAAKDELYSQRKEK